MPTCFSGPTPEDYSRFVRHLKVLGLPPRTRGAFASFARSLVAHRPELPTRDRIQSWLQETVRTSKSLRRAYVLVGGMLPFLDFCQVPDLHQILDQVRSRTILLRELASPGATWEEAFEVARKPRFKSGLAEWLEAFLHHRAGRQMKLDGWGSELRRLDRLALQYKVASPEQLTPAIIEQFLTENRPGPCTRNTRLSKLRVLQRFLEPRGAQLHLPAGLEVRAPRFRPHLYTLSEIGRILEVLRARRNSGREFRWLGIETIVFLLYACGMRIREPLGLRMQDVDLVQNTLFVHCTKFYKQRWVPLGHGAVSRLEAYRSARQSAFPARNDPGDPFFLNLHGKGLSKAILEGEFAAVVTELQIETRGTRRPRLHDLRHTLAVHRLYQWYAEEADVQNKLPLLSAYLGHDRLHHTEVYLHLTDDLVRQAGRNFHRSFEQIVGRSDLHGWRA